MSLPIELRKKGVIIHAPLATTIEDVDPDRIEAGVEIFPGTVLRGQQTLLGAGTKLGKAGGGYFEDVRTGRNVDLFGGYFQDAVFLDNVTVRGHAEMRGGTLMEEGAEAAHHVGYKMTIVMPYVVAGSLINFCDALIAGGTSRADHSEIGSTLALYNYTPWGDKFASLFGDVPRGVFLKERRIFVGGQTQIVSPVHVDYGAVVPAGCAVRRDVGPDRIYGEVPTALDSPFDPGLYGGLRPKFEMTIRYVANLRCLAHWYRKVRMPIAGDDAHLRALYEAALQQIEAGVAERLKRLDKLVAKLPDSLERHREEQRRADSSGDAGASKRHRRRIIEHQSLIDAWPKFQPLFVGAPDPTETSALDELVGAYQAAAMMDDSLPYTVFISELVTSGMRERGVAHLQAFVDALTV